jgi:parvulin-like peptidyl-prolyl isomerase
MGDVLYQAVYDMDPGTVSAPVKLDDGYHVVQVTGNQKPRPLPYEHARTQLLNDNRTDQQARLMNNTLSFLRNRSKILIADDYKNDYVPQPYAGAGSNP